MSTGCDENGFDDSIYIFQTNLKQRGVLVLIYSYRKKNNTRNYQKIILVYNQKFDTLSRIQILINIQL